MPLDEEDVFVMWGEMKDAKCGNKKEEGLLGPPLLQQK
jgi:hypothetical protein